MGKPITLSLAALVALAASAGARADSFTLEGTDVGWFYIPLQPSSSGTLGDGTIGIEPDVITLSPWESSSGTLEVWLDYTPQLADVQDLIWPTASARLDFGFYDLDLQDDWSSNIRLFETVTIEAADFVGSANRLLIADLNESWANAEGLTDTDDEWFYASADLSGDVLDMMADENFALRLSFASDVKNYNFGSRSVQNTPEQLDFDINLVGEVPEPMTLGLLGAGFVGLVAARRRARRTR
jgi:hypothetical protein